MEVQNLNNSFSPNWDQFSGTLIYEAFRGDDVFTSTCVALNSTTLITAAHSVENVDFAFVHLNSDYNQQQGQRLKVIKTYIHPDYNKDLSNYKNDIAIIKLARPLPDWIRTYSISSLVSTRMERIGFGARDGKNIRTWTHVNLKEKFENYLVLEDWCSVIGDSGGPLFCQRKGIYELIAIHSTLEGENTTYAVRLAPYRDWIIEKTNSFFLLEA